MPDNDLAQQNAVKLKNSPKLIDQRASQLNLKQVWMGRVDGECKWTRLDAENVQNDVWDINNDCHGVNCRAAVPLCNPHSVKLSSG